MENSRRALFLLLFLVITAAPIFAQPNLDESLKIEVDFKSNYQIYGKPWPSTVDLGVDFAGRFHEDSTGTKNHTPFENANGLLWIAD
ncbi:MAG: hypothetical protein KDC38_06370, partial [Planctomycetes bacterium]|nr:hypothetical protein [Planctomycetota bacterium]